MEHLENTVLLAVLLYLGIFCPLSVTSTEISNNVHTLQMSDFTVSRSHVSESGCNLYTHHKHVLVDLITACRSTWNNAVVFSSQECPGWCELHEQVQHFINSLGITSVHYDISDNRTTSEAVDEIVLNSYVQKGVTNFIWIVADPGKRIHDVDRIVRNNSISSLMPNRVHFLFLSCAGIIENFQNHFQNFVIDNVVVLIMEKSPVSKVEGYTLMWRENRRREFDSITHVLNETHDKVCSDFFPNTKFKLNGRDIVGLAKEYRPFLDRTTNPATGKLQYTGFYTEFNKLLAELLNFTLILYPDAGEDDKITWGNYSEIVAQGKVDYGIVLWISNSVFNFNHTLSYPLIYSNMIGIYSKKRQNDIYAHFKLFHYEVYIVVLASMTYTIAMYMALKKITLRFNLKAETNEQENWEGASCFTIESTLSADTSGFHDSEGVEDVMPCDKHKHTSQLQEKTYIKNSTAAKASFSHSENFNCCRPSLGTETDDHVSPCQDRPNLRTPSTKICDTLTSYKRDNHFDNQSENNPTCRRAYKRDNTTGQSKRLHGLTRWRENPSCPLGRQCTSSQSNVQNFTTSTSQVVDYFFRFLGSIFNQSVLPRPEQTSVRLLIWFWSMMLIALTAAYTGDLTAFFVNRDRVESFETFNDMINAGGYKWGLEEGSTLLGVMGKAKKDSTLRRLYDGMMEFSETDPSIMGSVESLIQKTKTEKFVALVYKTRFEISEEYKSDGDLRTIHEDLIPTNNCLIFPEISELRRLVSEQIVKIMDSGLVYALSDVGDKTDSPPESSPQQSPLGVQHLLGTFYVCIGGIFVATLILSVEFICARLLWNRENQ